VGRGQVVGGARRREGDGQTVLHWAAREGQWDVVKWLESKSRIMGNENDDRYNSGLIALHTVARYAPGLLTYVDGP